MTRVNYQLLQAVQHTQRKKQEIVDYVLTKSLESTNIKIKLALSPDKKRKFNLDFGRD